ncbi:MAG TPA: hypothetical protein P5527_10700 [Kiritimatiellia bacterium]|jgi:hypothetical protein|nr:hypothetical protein [Kiritimatiellia bacterium]
MGAVRKSVVSRRKSGVSAFVARVRREARLRRETVVLKSMGHERVFIAYDWGSDTFIFEKDVWKHLENHSPVLIVRKRDLIKGTGGYVMTLTTGNHTVASIPLLSGQFWNLGRVPASRRSKTLRDAIVCANVVDGVIEVSQRDVPTDVVTGADEWLQSVGFALNDVIMGERNDAALEYYRQQGQEWRVKPLAWTRREMDAALAASRTRIDTRLRYYHSAKGVHFLTYTDFNALLVLIEADYAGFVECLRELVSVFEGDVRSCMRSPKFHGHNEIELFGLRRGVACEMIVPELEQIMEGIALERLDASQVAERMRAVDAQFKASLERPELADESSEDFVETLYSHLTGEVYYGSGAAIAPAFDDRRTALPGATFRGGRPDFHPGADERTRVLLANVQQIMSQGEIIEYANIYEVRSASDATNNLTVGAGATREIVVKTNRRPLCMSLIEKRLAQKTSGYGSYMLARVEAFKALGVGFGEYRLLSWLDSTAGREMNYFIRSRSPGEPLEDIPPRLFQRTGEFGGNQGGKDPRVVLKIGALLGDAAAQNLVLKKYLPETGGCRFGEGKEIFDFGYDITVRREMPKGVKICSVRGSCGWPNNAHTEENLDELFDFYFDCYSRVLHRFWLNHRDAVPLDTLAEHFFDGFEFKTREMHWNYSVRREQFDDFDPGLPKHYGFAKRWRFALWSLERQLRRIESLRTHFMQHVRRVAKASGDERGNRCHDHV